MEDENGADDDGDGGDVATSDEQLRLDYLFENLKCVRCPVLLMALQ